MTTQPEALRLADALTAATGQTDAEDDVIHVARWFVEDAAAQLRRLSAENDLLGSAADKLRVAWRDEVHRLHAENEALRAALAAVRFQCEADAKAGEWTTSITRLLDAIKAVEEA